MINYAIAPAVLRPFVPAGTELDTFEGVHFVSLVGFQFLQTKLFGLGLPFHQNFEEVNLRFYVRARGPEGWRRGVVFLRELVPRRAIAWVARTFYGEPYTAVPMRHEITCTGDELSVRYAWFRDRRWESLCLTGTGRAEAIGPGTVEEFITEHYWGYTTRRTGSTQYQVEHPRWTVRQGRSAAFEADIASLYGASFVECLSAPPASAFLAEGSPVLVRTHRAYSRAGAAGGISA